MTIVNDIRQGQTRRQHERGAVVAKPPVKRREHSQRSKASVKGQSRGRVSGLDAVYRAVPALGHLVSDQELTRLAREEHAQHVALEGRDWPVANSDTDHDEVGNGDVVVRVLRDDG